ncbi:uncharacterized protein [Macrobrachium rosenbergii]|uniref:uncharacterized protein n=1 Tax=Macrobrachium rosenbergii TaxID=79674 RepID=UPI0034D3F927
MTSSSYWAISMPELAKIVSNGGVIGKHSVGKMNSNGLLLLSEHAEYDLLMTNTMFRLDDKCKTTWMHPRTKQWHLIGYVITGWHDPSDFFLTRAKRGADCWTDRRLLRAKLNIRIVPYHSKRSKTIRAAINTARLLSPSYLWEFQTNMDEKFGTLGPLSGGPEEKWNKFHEVTTETAKTILCPKKMVYQDWFDENDEAIQTLLDRKRKAFIDWQNHPNCPALHDRFKDYQTRSQRGLHTMQYQWWEKKVEEVQHYVDTNSSKMLFCIIKTIYGPSMGGTAPLPSADSSTTIKEKEGISARREEHFSQLLNLPSTVDQTAMQQIPQKPAQGNLTSLPPRKKSGLP